MTIDVKKAIRKQQPMIVTEADNIQGTIVCPWCGDTLYAKEDIIYHCYCYRCGQALDMEEVW